MAVAAPALGPQVAPRPAPAPRPDLRLVPPAPATVSRSVYRRRRLTVVAVAALLVVGLWAASGLATPADAYLDAPAVATVVVGEGDTVWGIAAAHAPEGSDVRRYVAEVLTLNRVDATVLRPGSVLRLP